MGARLLFAGLVAISTLVVAGPASAKPSVAGARISGPGIDGEMTIGHGDAAALWEYGISRADSLKALGLTPSDLGVRYFVTYSFGFRDDIRQDLYPYAEDGPVTYTPPHQELTGLFGEAGYICGSPRGGMRAAPLASSATSQTTACRKGIPSPQLPRVTPLRTWHQTPRGRGRQPS